MLRIEIKEGENIERALKRYKRKHRNIKVMQNLKTSNTLQTFCKKKTSSKSSLHSKLRDLKKYRTEHI